MSDETKKTLEQTPAQKDDKNKKPVGVGGPMREMNETLLRIERVLLMIENKMGFTPLDTSSSSTVVITAADKGGVTEIDQSVAPQAESRFPIPYEFQELKNTLHAVK